MPMVADCHNPWSWISAIETLKSLLIWVVMDFIILLLSFREKLPGKWSLRVRMPMLILFNYTKKEGGRQLCLRVKL